MFSISVCMIVKDEELTIERILSCASQFADEIIIVDTGSKDRTIELTQKYTNNIYRFDWCDDFSKARNYSFSLANKDYILWLDADDVITEDNINKIKLLKKSKDDIDIYMFKYVLFDKDKKTPLLEYYRERLIKRSLNLRWSGFVHETITPTGKIKYTDIEIEHRKMQSGNPKRNLRLYQKALKSGIEFSPREIYYYARELYYNGYYKKAITKLKQFLKTPNKYPPNIIEAEILLSDIYRYYNDYNKAKSHLLNILLTYNATSEVCCKLGEIFLLENNISNAIFWLNSATICTTQKEGFVNHNYSNFIPYTNLSIAYYRLGKMDIAKDYYKKASQLQPDHPSILYNSQFFK